MKRPRSIGFSFILVVAIAGGAILARQRQHTMDLHRQLEIARGGQAVLERLRTENQRLQVNQVSAAQLETLRADHAALPRLRAELAALKKNGVAPP